MEKVGELDKNNAKLLKNTLIKSEERCFAANTAATANCDAAGQDAWLALHVNNNNNTLGASELAKRKHQQQLEQEQQQHIQCNATTNNHETPTAWSCESCDAAVGVNAVKHTIDAKDAADDKGGGVTLEAQQAVNKAKFNQQNGATTGEISKKNHQSSSLAKLAAAVVFQDSEPDSAGEYDDACAIGAASLTPPENSHSNRTSINNSTENLSYSSDNYYQDNLIFLEDDDVEAEEISLNSDDCVYAYRGDGADFVSLDAIAGRFDANVGDDETDFLEMDFEPDPLSEAEYGFVETAVPPPAAAFQMQRDFSHLSGRHSANMSLNAMPTQRQLFSSPIDDLPPPKALQSQALLSKNFARVALHLDQIKGEGADGDALEGIAADVEPLHNAGANNDINKDFSKNAAAHSLPSTLNSNFVREILEPQPIINTCASPSKVTGAKPKRLTNFSNTASISVKSSSKSRNSLRASNFTPAICGSSSFDERSVSCAEFRSSTVAAPEECIPNVVATVEDNNTNDETTCLDCLEKEFLASTIGKAMDSNDCVKCRRKRSTGLFGYKRAESTRRRSGSPQFFGEIAADSIFEGANQVMHAPCKREEWTAPAKHTVYDSKACAKQKDDIQMLLGFLKDGDNVNQRRALCDNLNGEQLLKNLILTEKEIATISTVNLSEDSLVQALDKLHIYYNHELVKSHYKRDSSTNCKNFKTLKHYLLHESKKNCNYHKLKRLIDLVTHQKVEAVYKDNKRIKKPEFIPVSVSAILHQWTRMKDLDSLKTLDERFIEANILGKIANIIRQSEQRCLPRRPLPEFISIPQYYPSGYLSLTKKC